MTHPHAVVITVNLGSLRFNHSLKYSFQSRNFAVYLVASKTKLVFRLWMGNKKKARA